jgi:Tol biopolymer transport system component
MDSTGKLQPLTLARGAYGVPRISPDGRKVAFLGEGADVYVYDLERDTPTRLTFTGATNVPVWAPDSKHLVFESTPYILWMRSDGAGEPQRLFEGANLPRPASIAPDGNLVYFERGPETGFDIWTLPLDLTDADHPKAGKPEPFLRTPVDELVPRFSPDGRWIAYRSNESGSSEIYVRPFPASRGGKWQISTAGGLYAFWSNNGRELFYETTDNRIMAVDYTVDGASFMPRKPRPWSEKQIFSTGTQNLDIAPDGKRFVVLSMPDPPPDEKRSVHVTVLENFFDWVRSKLP